MAGSRQVRVELLQLLRGQHPFVNDGFVRKAGDIEAFASRQHRPADCVLGKLADDVQLALERHVVGHLLAAADKHLPHAGLARPGGGAERGIVRRHGAPAQHGLPRRADDLLQFRLARGALPGVAWQVDHAYAVGARLGQIEPGRRRRRRGRRRAASETTRPRRRRCWARSHIRHGGADSPARSMHGAGFDSIAGHQYPRRIRRRTPRALRAGSYSVSCNKRGSGMYMRPLIMGDIRDAQGHV